MLYDNAKNLMLDELALTLTHVALLDETETEISGGDPAYERQEINWNSAEDGEITASNEPTFDVPEGVTVAYVAFYDSLTEGEEYAMHDVTNESYGGQGTYTVTSASIDLNA